MDEEVRSVFKARSGQKLRSYSPGGVRLSSGMGCGTLWGGS